VLGEVLKTPESINLHVTKNLTKPQTWIDILVRPNFNRSYISSLEPGMDGVDRNHLGGNLGFQGCVIEGFVFFYVPNISVKLSNVNISVKLSNIKQNISSGLNACTKSKTERYV